MSMFNYSSSLAKIHSFFIATVLVLTAFTANATATLEPAIHEVFSFKQITDHVKPGTLLVLDLDNTVIRTAQTVGSDEWFEAHLKARLANGQTFTNALNDTLSIYDPVHMLTAVVLVEPDTAKLIADLQHRGIEVCALTTRGKRLSQAAIRQLESVGISFNHGAFKDRNVDLSDIGTDSYATNGIILAGGKHKGDCLDAYLTAINMRPAHIVFADDKIKNVLQVKDSATRLGATYHGFRYGYTDKLVNNVNLELGDAQAQLLSDEEAQLILEHRAAKRRG